MQIAPRGVQAPDTSLIELEYSKALVALVDDAQAAVRREVATFTPPEVLTKARKDSAPASIEAFLARVSTAILWRFPTGTLDTLARRYHGRTSDAQRAQLRAEIAAAIGADVFAHDTKLPRLLSEFTSENVRLVQDASKELSDGIDSRVRVAVRKGAPWRKVAAEIDARFDVGKSRARLIARDQIGKAYSDLAHARQEDAGITGYIWRTARDPRVRDDHARREGEHFEWSDAPAGGHPGHAIQCRCYAEPDFSTIRDNTASVATEFADKILNKEIL